VVINDVGVVDGIVDVADGGCASIVSGVICVKVSVVVVEVIWELESVVARSVGSVCTSPLPHFVSHFSRLAVLPLSSPSFTPSSYPSFLPSSEIEVLPFSSVLAIVPFTNLYACSRPHAMMAS
jgi:hypothetical protein